MVNGVGAAEKVGDKVAVAGVTLVEVDLGTTDRPAFLFRWTVGSARRARELRVLADSSRSQVWEPMNPAPPVTRIFISVFLKSHAHSVFGVTFGFRCCHGSEHSRCDRVRTHSRLTDALGQSVHDGLVQILDYAGNRALDMNADLSQGLGSASVKASDRDGAEAMVPGPRESPYDIGRTT